MSLTETEAWVVCTRSGTSRGTYHTNEQCTNLDQARNYRAASGQEVRMFEECQKCAGTSNEAHPEKNDRRTCPLCGDEFGNLANHMRHCR